MSEDYRCAQCGAPIEYPSGICDSCFRRNEAFDRQFEQEQEEERRKREEENR